ncbi:urotensin 2 domain containing precursor [Danio rerio]|uniref:Urotensin 2 domain containing precursor n=1 Tax=Danio rerio TaxID=7955 RepID=H9T836_DANRE|nr:urotensin 2 domain containing precursor [Danio rerio]AFG17056.1 urotensin II-related peptide precursor [Danio rerio]|eukprot:NP_001245247.1 urotensin 2 domain containing precursor [Danio rerio]
MDRTIPSVLLQIAFLLLVGAFSVHTRSLESPVNQVFQSKDDSDIQDQILAFLLRKNVMPLQEKDLLGLELARKITELQELQKELNLERKLVSNAMDNRRSMTRKRDDTCFWKYCV